MAMDSRLTGCHLGSCCLFLIHGRTAAELPGHDCDGQEHRAQEEDEAQEAPGIPERSWIRDPRQIDSAPVGKVVAKQGDNRREQSRDTRWDFHVHGISLAAKVLSL